MRRALGIAATCSVALHLTALAISEYLLDDSATPSIATRILALDLRVSHADVAVEHDAPDLRSSAEDPGSTAASTAAHTDVPDSRVTATDEAVDPASPPSAREPEIAPASSETVAASPPRDDSAAAVDADIEDASDAESESAETPGAAPEAAARSSAGVREDPARVASVRVERDARRSTRSAGATVPHAETLSDRQKEMLSRRIRKWTQNPERLAQADGMRWEHQGQEYVATFRPLSASDDQAIEQAIVEITTERDGRRLTTEMRMRRLAFSNYAQFVNRWDPAVGLHDDELDGRFHSNTEISLANDRRATPRFHGKVTTAAHRVDYGDGPVRRGEIFLGGLETGVGSIRFPERFVPFPADTGARDDRVRYFDEDTRITFYADGTYGWRRIGSRAEERRVALTQESSYLIATGKAELHVAGTLDGKVLLYSPERIVIEGDLVYVSDPATVADADDYLGLVSDKYVDVAAPEVTGPGDLTIDAAIYAKRGFAVRHYGAKRSGRLDIYGSVTAGSLSATEPRYTTRIRFDPRLEKLRPPAFPMTDRYEVESWDGVWRVGSAADTH